VSSAAGSQGPSTNDPARVVEATRDTEPTKATSTSKAQADAERARAGLVSAVDDLTDAARAIKSEGVATARRQAPKVGAAVGGLVSLRVLLKLLKRRRS
jgi:hypothetical protein